MQHTPPQPFDFARYAHLLDDPEIPEDQKEELLRTLWSILMQFIALDIPIPDLPEKVEDQNCGQVADEAVSKSFEQAVMVKSKKQAGGA